MGNYLISKTLLEGKLFPLGFPQRRAENKMKWNGKRGNKKKPDGKEAVEPYYTGWTEKRRKRWSEWSR